MNDAEWWNERAGFDGSVAVITGGAGGLGEAITLDLAANGVRVAFVDRDAAAVDEISSALNDRGNEHIGHVGDAREPTVLDLLFDEVAERWSRLDTLVNVVGGTFHGPFAEQAPKAWDALLRTNFTHVLHATSRAIPAMRAGQRGGSIVSITTIEGHRAAPNFAVYSAAKAAVTQFSRTLAVELAPDRIRVNCVAPDLAPTPNMMGITSNANAGLHPMLDPTNIAVSIPMGRVGTPTDVSNAVIFLASGLASYVTGTTLHPDGGTLASSGWMNWPESGFANTLPPEVLHTVKPRATTDPSSL